MLNKKNFQTEEDILFIKEYGEDNLYIWQDMTETQKKEYLEIEHQYSIFCDLYQNNYEDLKYYSTMYRNVSLHSIGKDPISVLYFASKHKEIIGYKKKLFKDISPKAKIAILYNENPALFPKVVEKLIGQKIHRSYPKTSKVDFYIYEELKRGNYESVFSVNDLSESECEKIIKIESKILDEYRLVYDECSEAFAPKLSTEDIKDKDYFITNYFIPQILSDKNPDSIQTKRINHFINSLGYIELPYLKKEYQDYLQIYRQSINIRATLGLSFSEQEDTVFKSHYEYVSSYRFQISILEGKLRGLNFKTCQLNSQLFRILPPTETLQKIKETHKEYKDIKKEIEETEKELENLKTREREEYSNWLRVQEQVKEKYKQEKQKEEERITQEKERLEQKRTDALLELKNKIKNTDLFEFVLANYENIEQYIVSSCERLYNILWLRNSEKIKIRESHTTGAVCIRDLMCETHRTLGESYFGWLKSKKTDKYIFRFSKRRLFADYGCVLQLEKKEKERIQKELFAKRREEEFKKQKIEEEKNAKKKKPVEKNITTTKETSTIAMHIYHLMIKLIRILWMDKNCNQLLLL